MIMMRSNILTQAELSSYLSADILQDSWLLFTQTILLRRESLSVPASCLASLTELHYCVQHNSRLGEFLAQLLTPVAQTLVKPSACPPFGRASLATGDETCPLN